MEQNSVPVPPVTAQGSLQSVAVLLRETIKFFRTHYKKLIAIASVPIIFSFIAVLIGDTNPILAGVLGFAGALLSIVTQVGLINAVHNLSTNSSQEITVKGQLNYGVGKLLSLIWLFIVSAAIGLGFIIPLVFALTGLVMVGLNPLTDVLSMVLFALVLLVGLVPFIAVGFYMMFTQYALVVDDKWGMDAVVESYSVVKNNVGAVVWRVLVVGLLYLVIMIVVSILGVGTVLSDIFEVLIGIVLIPISIIFMYKLYQSLKHVRSDNIDRDKVKRNFTYIFPAGILIGLIFMVIFSIIKMNV